MSLIFEADKTAPLLASSTSFFTIFTKKAPTYYARWLGLNIKKLGLFILSHLHIAHPSETALKHLEYKILHNSQKALSISNRFKYRKFLLAKTRNFPALPLMETGADVRAGEVYKQVLFARMQKDLLKEGGFTPERIANRPFRKTGPYTSERTPLFELPAQIKTADSGVCVSMVMALAKKN